MRLKTQIRPPRPGCYGRSGFGPPRDKPPKESQMAVITISKEFGTKAEKVAEIVAARLGYTHIGKGLLSEIADELKISESDVEVFRQYIHSRLMKLVDKYTCSMVQRVVSRDYGCLDDKAYYETTKGLVEKLYDAGDVIILGWGGQCILQGKPGVLHVRLFMDEEEKIKNVMADRRIKKESAKNLVRVREKESREYVRYYFKADWADPSLYDLVIDVTGKSPEDVADEIEAALKAKLG